MVKHIWRSLTAGATCVVLGATLAAHQPPTQGTGQTTDEDIARRQLDSGRSFLRQGNYPEALKDFRAVANDHATSSVADDALLEIGRYFFEIANDYPAATTAVDDLLKKYPTSNSAPDAYTLAGRLALARSHQPADLEAALANFDRVIRLVPGVERRRQRAGVVGRDPLVSGPARRGARRIRPRRVRVPHDARGG